MDLSHFSSIKKLILYRKLLHDPVLTLCQSFLQHPDQEKQAEIYCQISHELFLYNEMQPVLDDLWKNYILGIIIADENPFSLACEKAGLEAAHPALLASAEHDLSVLYQLYQFDWSAFGRTLSLPAERWFARSAGPVEADKPADSYGRTMRQLAANLSRDEQLLTVFSTFYRQQSCGMMAKYKAFRWDGVLIGIEHPDPVRLDDLIGYEYQKKTLQENTQAFIKRQGGNHVLLYGDRGTGKSSSVKALLNEYAAEHLHMVELKRTQLHELNQLIEILRRRSGSYIVFIDDLSFEDFEVEYKYLKSHIEGSLQAPAGNVRIYVTSNRRHLIRETWQEREHQEEVHRRDAQQEKLSFADRFGLTITYTSPDQDSYLQMVRQMAEKEGITIDAHTLDRLAVQWELQYHGRSGRTARQFINDLKSKS